MEPISPLDGRYRRYVEPLAAFTSEEALIRYRARVETEYLIALSEHPKVGLRRFSAIEKRRVRALARLSPKDIVRIREIEQGQGRDAKLVPSRKGGARGTNHDVKAIEYFLKEKLKRTSLKDTTEWVHFALTSEDVNSTAYGLMLSDAVGTVIVPIVQEIARSLDALARKHKSLPMLGRTHGQPATPTTFGKEMKVFAVRLLWQLATLRRAELAVKWSGAVGNWNAHVAAYPKANWMQFTKRFISRFNKRRLIRLVPNLITTQIEPHDSYAELFDTLRRINVMLIDFSQDMWRYISDGWILQRAVESETGSSTMPHKINPIKFENAEGNLGIANALFTHFSLKLPISRLQRDLSDSTVERNFGVALGHSLVAYRYILEGLSRISPNAVLMREELATHPEVLAEAIQIILRREGVAASYEKLKALTRGTQVALDDLRTFIASLRLSDAAKRELMSLTPEHYLGLAERLAQWKRKV